MKKRGMELVVLGAALLLLLAGCSLFEPGGPSGQMAFNLNLAYPKSLGYDITSVHVVLEHQASGVQVEQDLAVDPDGTQAHGVIGDLRIGSWDLTVTLYEDGAEIGSGSTVVEVLHGQTTNVQIGIELYAGSVDLTVTWSTNGGGGGTPEDGTITVRVTGAGEHNGQYFYFAVGVVEADLQDPANWIGAAPQSPTIMDGTVECLTVIPGGDSPAIFTGGESYDVAGIIDVDLDGVPTSGVDYLFGPKTVTVDGHTTLELVYPADFSLYP